MGFYPLETIKALLPAPPRGRALRLAVDGGSGSGKSTLGKELGALPGVQVIQFDEFFLKVPDEELLQRRPEDDIALNFNHDRMQAQLWDPLLAGHNPRFQQINWQTAGLGDWREVENQGILVLEGVYSMRPNWADRFDFRIWVETAVEVRKQRLLARRSTTPGQLDFWQRAETWYIGTYEPAAQADLVLSGEDGRILRQGK